MAEYFPLIDRAVTGLPDSTAESRRSIYERARAALIGQLRKTVPPIPEEDIARESAALDEAIARVEAKFTDHGVSASGLRQRAGPSSKPAEPTGRPAALAPPAAGSPAVKAARGLPPGPAGPVLPVGKAPPIGAPPSRDRPVLGPAPSVAAEDRSPAVPPRPPQGLRPPARPALPVRPTPSGNGGPPRTRPTEGGADAAKTPSLPPARDLDLPPAEPDAARTGRDFDDALEAAGRDGGSAEVADGVKPTAPRGRDTANRPAAPRPPPQPRRFGWPALLAAGAVLVLMLGVGVAAWMTRDKADQVVAARPEVHPADSAPAGKIGDRAAPAGADGQPGNGSAGSGSAVPAPAPPNGGSDPGPAIAVAQRAALLVSAPDEPQKIKTYTGTVVWTLDSVSPGQGQPLTAAVKADIDIPDAKLKVTMLVQKNLEAQLPASYTIEIHVLPQPGYALGNVKQVNVPEMRKDDDAPTGDPLAGKAVVITDNYFLVGLERGAASDQNIRLITERNWFDMGLLFGPKLPGKLTFEKGAAGERVWEDAIKAWGGAQ